MFSFFMPPMELFLALSGHIWSLLHNTVCRPLHQAPFSPAMLTHVLLNQLALPSGLTHLTGTIRWKESWGESTGWECHLNIYQDTFSFFLLKTKTEKTQSSVEHLTLDDEFPVLIAGVFHGVEGLLGDAVEVHVPPVFQHLECDVCTVDHCPRCL